ncbi:MAG: tetratricopeptide repeat protein [Atribacterota bacterium]|nr:tetratricopeptide repeat protein [Atribacterota bacterium]
MQHGKWLGVLLLVLFLCVDPAFSLGNQVDLMEQALNARKEGDYTRAMSLLEECVQEGVRVHDAYYEMGLILLEKGEYRKAFSISEKAVQAFRKHLDEHPEDHWSWLRLGYIHEVRSEAPTINEWREAREALEKAIELSPQNPLYLLHLGFVYYRMKENSKAEETLRLALSVQPDNVEIHYFLALTLKAQGRNEEAKEEFRFVVEHASSEYKNYDSARRELIRLERMGR